MPYAIWLIIWYENSVKNAFSLKESKISVTDIIIVRKIQKSEKENSIIHFQNNQSQTNDLVHPFDLYFKQILSMFKKFTAELTLNNR